MKESVPWYSCLKDSFKSMGTQLKTRKSKSPYIAVSLLFIAGLWNYHQFLKNGGLQEREIPAHYVKSRSKRSNLSSARHPTRHKPPVSKHHNNSWICTAEERISNLHAACHRYRHSFLNTRVKFGSQFIVDDTRKIVYCQVPHVGSYSMKALLKSINPNNTAHGSKSDSGYPSPGLGDWSHGLESHGLTHMTKLLPRYSHYKKFLIVRNPFDRILSVYNSIVHQSIRIDSSARDYIKAVYNTGDKLAPLTFDKFVQFLTDTTVPHNVYKNPHWRSITDTCFPCHIKYNRIIKLETIQTDAIFLNQLNILPSKLPHLNKAQQSNTYSTMGTKLLPQFYSISTETMSKLKHRYRVDMDIFGYKFDTKQSEAACRPPSLLPSVYDCC